MIRQSTTAPVIAVAISAIALSSTLAARPDGQREWRDYAGGPDSSRFVAAKQITSTNVNQLQVAWAYTSGQTDFNPLVIRGMVYGRGANGSFVAEPRMIRFSKTRPGVRVC